MITEQVFTFSLERHVYIGQCDSITCFDMTSHDKTLLNIIAMQITFALQIAFALQITFEFSFSIIVSALCVKSFVAVYAEQGRNCR